MSFSYVFLSVATFLSVSPFVSLSVHYHHACSFFYLAHHFVSHFSFCLCCFFTTYGHTFLCFSFVVLSWAKVACHYRQRHRPDKGQKPRQKCLQTGSAGVSDHVCGVCVAGQPFTWAHQTGTEEEDRLGRTVNLHPLSILEKILYSENILPVLSHT